MGSQTNVMSTRCLYKYAHTQVSWLMVIGGCERPTEFPPTPVKSAHGCPGRGMEPGPKTTLPAVGPSGVNGVNPSASCRSGRRAYDVTRTRRAHTRDALGARGCH